MRKNKDPLGYFTIKISDDHYARAAQAAAISGISIAELMRLYLNALPPVTASQIESWKRYRHRSGHEKPGLPVEYMISVNPQISTAVPRAVSTERQESGEEMFARIKREEVLKEWKEREELSNIFTKARTHDATQPLTVIERAELEELAEKGDKEAKQKLQEDDKRRELQKLTQL